jgi:hypothetical protein
MEKRINKMDISFGTKKDHEKEDKAYWSKASNEEKFATITYLRECFYGPEATAGKLPKCYMFSKRKLR